MKETLQNIKNEAEVFQKDKEEVYEGIKDFEAKQSFE